MYKSEKKFDIKPNLEHITWTQFNNIDNTIRYKYIIMTTESPVDNYFSERKTLTNMG